MPHLDGMPTESNVDDDEGRPESSLNNDTIYEVCLCPSGKVFAATIAQGCFDTARDSGVCADPE